MLNFDYYNPTRIVFGKDSIARIDKLVPANARFLILYGGGSAERNGTLAEGEAALGARTLQRFGGIEPNPSYETLMGAVEQVRREKLDFLLAVGGGSVIDGTKFVAAAVNYTGEPWDILETSGKHVSQALPMGCVRTLPATGSEMNCLAVVTRKSLQAKLSFASPLVFPQFSVLDAADAQKIISEIVKATDKQTLRRAAAVISNWKNALLDPDAALHASPSSRRSAT